MTNLYAKFCALMAGADISSRELHRLLSDLKSIDPSKVVEDVRSLNKFVNTQYRQRSTVRFVEKEKENSNDELSNRVIDLLIRDTGLPRGYVAQVLYDALKMRDPIRSIPQPTKVAFGSWIERVMKVVPPSELLHVVYSIKDKLDGHAMVDWKLRD